MCAHSQSHVHRWTVEVKPVASQPFENNLKFYIFV